MSKLFDLHHALGKEAKKEKKPELTEDSLPLLWILTPTLSAPILEGFGAKLDLELWGESVYLMPAHFKTGLSSFISHRRHQRRYGLEYWVKGGCTSKRSQK